jgi:ribosomal protein S18 acetylase RimI-like enzyme
MGGETPRRLAPLVLPAHQSLSTQRRAVAAEISQNDGGEAMQIRDFGPPDAEALVDLLKANQQYGHPDTDGPEAMLRVHQCQAAEFLVAEEEGRIVGMIRGTFDGSRAVIYLASVHPSHQRKGIGRALVHEIARRFRDRGAASIAVIVPGDADFWKTMGFRQTTRVMQAYPIEEALTG